MQNNRVLEKNWGDRADYLDCFACMLIYDTESRWQCYVYARNPMDNDEARVLINNGFDSWSYEDVNLPELINAYCANTGRNPLVDLNFRPKHLKHIHQGKINDEE